jgi:hypothetical protein
MRPCKGYWVEATNKLLPKDYILSFFEIDNAANDIQWYKKYFVDHGTFNFVIFHFFLSILMLNIFKCVSFDNVLFLETEHQNYFGRDDKLGPYIVSVMKDVNPSNDNSKLIRVVLRTKKVRKLSLQQYNNIDISYKDIKTTRITPLSKLLEISFQTRSNV